MLSHYHPYYCPFEMSGRKDNKVALAVMSHNFNPVALEFPLQYYRNSELPGIIDRKPVKSISNGATGLWILEVLYYIEIFLHAFLLAFIWCPAGIICIYIVSHRYNIWYGIYLLLY